MKAIAYILPNFPVLSETFILTEMRAMQRRGHRILPIILRDYPGKRQPDSGDIAAISTFLPKTGPWPARHLLRGFTLGAAWKFATAQTELTRHSLLWNGARIAGIARAFGAQHLHAHFATAGAAHAIVAARLIGCSVSFVGHGFDIYVNPRDLPAKLGAADAVIAVCRDMQGLMAGLSPTARLITLPCGVDPSRFGRPDGTVENGRLLFIGRLVDMKGVPDLLQALSRIDPAIRPGLDLVGDGPMRADLEAQAAALGLTPIVQFLGGQASDWIARHGPSYLALAVPFRRGADGSRDTNPLVVKEAMAMGIPVITTNFGGAEDMADDRTGAMAEPHDPDSLAAAIRRVLAMGPAGRRALGEAGMARFQARFTDAAQACVLSDLIESL